MDGTPKKAPKDAAPTLHVMTGYRLTDGIVIWLTADNEWSEWVEDAATAAAAAEADALTAQAKEWERRNQVYEIYLVDVALKDGKPWPVKMREAMRAQGPSIHPQFGKQSERASGRVTATVYAGTKRTERGERKENREG